MYPRGGYKTQTVTQIGNLLAAFNRGQVSFRALRLYFAALAAVAAREAAERSAPKGRGRVRTARYFFEELAGICNCPVHSVCKELRALERAGLLLFSESSITFTKSALPGSQDLIAELACGRSALRPIPLPRPALRFIARSSRVATIKTMLAYCVRGLSLTREGEVRGKGTAKACWIADTFGISLRAVRLARGELIAARFISRDEGSKQWKLNRDGAYFAVNMAFSVGSSASATEDRIFAGASPFAPPTAENYMPFAPPYEDLKTPYGFKNQKARCREQTGSCRAGNPRKPNLQNVQIEDLRSVRRMSELHRQAVESGLAQVGEAGKVEFLAAAVHAIKVGTRNPAGLFAAIIRKRLWRFITQADEDRARIALRRAATARPPCAIDANSTHSLRASVSRGYDSARGIVPQYVSTVLSFINISGCQVRDESAVAIRDCFSNFAHSRMFPLRGLTGTAKRQSGCPD